MTADPREAVKAWWAIAVVVVCVVSLAIVGVLYTNRVARESEQKWCGIVVTLDDSYSVPRPPNAPPLTPAGERIIKEMRRLRTDFHC